MSQTSSAENKTGVMNFVKKAAPIGIPAILNILASGKFGEFLTQQTLYPNVNIALGLALITMTESAILFYIGYRQSGQKHLAEKETVELRAGQHIESITTTLGERIENEKIKARAREKELLEIKQRDEAALRARAEQAILDVQAEAERRRKETAVLIFNAVDLKIHSDVE